MNKIVSSKFDRNLIKKKKSLCLNGDVVFQILDTMAGLSSLYDHSEAYNCGFSRGAASSLKLPYTTGVFGSVKRISKKFIVATFN